jgi:hypothetical protein
MHNFQKNYLFFIILLFLQSCATLPGINQDLKGRESNSLNKIGLFNK